VNYIKIYKNLSVKIILINVLSYLYNKNFYFKIFKSFIINNYKNISTMVKVGLTKTQGSEINELTLVLDFSIIEYLS
jgi:hypothetical protein